MKKIVEPEMTGLINRMQRQLDLLEGKIDILLSRPSPGQVEAKPFPRPFQQPDHRILHKAICADCNKECEVPFRPSQDRPVYCKECFSKRKAPRSFRGRPDSRHGESAPAQVTHIDRPYSGEKKKFFGKKRPAAKRRRKK